jgi:hypothetical protein
MAVKNNYWKVLSKTPRFYCVDGWEIHIHEDEYYTKDGVKKVMREAIPKDCKRSVRKNFRVKLARDKRIAQSVNTEKEYKELWGRIDPENWDFIEENDLKDSDLIHWAYNTRTADEYYRLLRYN